MRSIRQLIVERRTMTPFLLSFVLTLFSASLSDERTKNSVASFSRAQCDNSLAAMDEYCHRKFDALVSSIHNFSECIMQNSLSYGACGSCGLHYQYYIETKFALESDVRQDENNRTCAEWMHDTKRSLIDYQEKSPISLWTNGTCDKCYHLNETTGVREIHPDYAHFQRLIGKYQLCVNEHREKHLCNLTYVCGNCTKEYLELVHFYHASVNEKKSFLLCLDVKQKINASSHEWNNVFKCERLTKMDRFATYALSAFIILLPIAFYIGVNIQSEQKRIVYEFVRRSSFKPADDADIGQSVEVSPGRVGGAMGAAAVGGDTASSVAFFTCREDHDEVTPQELGYDRTWPGRRVSSTLTSAGTGSVSSESPRFRRSPVSSTNNLLM